VPKLNRPRPRQSHILRLPLRDTVDYEYYLDQADQLLAQNGIVPLPANWRALVLDWFPADEQAREAMARHIDAHASELGVDWAREMLRLEIFFQSRDDIQVVEHYYRALADYPPCSYLELEVAGPMIRYGGDLWTARILLWNALKHFPDRPKPYYDMGFVSHLLGDVAGALEWYNRGVSLVADDEAEIGARLLYNRGTVRYALDGDRDAAVADLERALDLYPDYPQARQTLAALQAESGERAVLPW
jgi:tetratricopeptide (TPR) repeat protein